MYKVKLILFSVLMAGGVKVCCLVEIPMVTEVGGGQQYTSRSVKQCHVVSFLFFFCFYWVHITLKYFRSPRIKEILFLTQTDKSAAASAHHVRAIIAEDQPQMITYHIGNDGYVTNKEQRTFI